MGVGTFRNRDDTINEISQLLYTVERSPEVIKYTHVNWWRKTQKGNPLIVGVGVGVGTFRNRDVPQPH
jgi:hypothetical protein